MVRAKVQEGEGGGVRGTDRSDVGFGVGAQIQRGG